MFPSPDSQAYKKTRRQHLKTTRNRDNTVDSEWTPFRSAEKRYKARFPPPDLSDVLDLGSDSGALLGRADAVECTEPSPMVDGKRVCIVPRVPGIPVNFLRHTMLCYLFHCRAGNTPIVRIS
jgi:alkylated DNA repair protein alkB family protein 1